MALSVLGVGSVPGAGLPAKSFPTPAPAAFSPLQSSFFLASSVCFLAPDSVSFLYFRKSVLVAVKASDTGLAKIKHTEGIGSHLLAAAECPSTLIPDQMGML